MLDWNPESFLESSFQDGSVSWGAVEKGTRNFGQTQDEKNKPSRTPRDWRCFGGSHGLKCRKGLDVFQGLSRPPNGVDEATANPFLSPPPACPHSRFCAGASCLALNHIPSAATDRAGE